MGYLRGNFQIWIYLTLLALVIGSHQISGQQCNPNLILHSMNAKNLTVTRAEKCGQYLKECLNQTVQQEEVNETLILYGTCSVRANKTVSVRTNVEGLQVMTTIPNKECHTVELINPNLTLTFERPSERINLQVTYYVYNVTSPGNFNIDCIVKSEEFQGNGEILFNQTLPIVFMDGGASIPAPGGAMLLLFLLLYLFVTCC